MATALTMISSLCHVLVELVESVAVSDPLHLGDEVAELLDGLDLLLEVLAFDEVGHLCVSVAVRLPVELEQALVHRPLQLQGVLHRLKGILPLRLGGLLDILEDDLSPAHVWYSMSFMEWSRSSSEALRKNLEKPGRAWSSRLKKELMAKYT